MTIPEIVLYGYEQSPYFLKVLSVLNLFGLPHKVCNQPMMLPRPDFLSLDITYRRIPLLSIGNSLYCDSSLIIQKLCELTQNEYHKEWEFIGKELFQFGSALLNPQSLPDDFLKDRSDLLGRPLNREAMLKNRPFALTYFTAHLDTIETQFLKEKKFVLGNLSIADIHVGFALINYLKLAHPISPQTHPKVYEWVGELQKLTTITNRVSFAEAKQFLTSHPCEFDKEPSTPDNHYLGLNKGDLVSVLPNDTGKNHPQKGQLVFIKHNEACVLTAGGVFVHFPLLGYYICKLNKL
ncbi:hypothetical protein HDV04_001165 [Boothiomyces sp. JEL0838]|nr:hypothetical protein HDV04_001165 [Boothiomyces sp. JEL0838]